MEKRILKCFISKLLAVFVLCYMMPVPQLQILATEMTGEGTTQTTLIDLSEKSLTIDKDDYQKAIITSSGKTTANRLIIDGVEVTLTIKDLKINATKGAGIELKGGAKVTLTLEGDNTIQSAMDYAGIQVPEGCELTITGTGYLTAIGGNYGAGIGGEYNQSSGLIIIKNGTITATGGNYGAGIGGGSGGSGTITIEGGTITATGGNYGAGIGGGYYGNGTVTINGGTITATGGDYGAGIGGGYKGSGDITIEGGTITATGGNRGAGIGGGYKGSGDITIKGGTITATGGEYGAGIGNGKDSKESEEVIITGGCIQANPIISSPKNSQGEVVLYKLTENDSKVDQIKSLGYGMNGVKPIEDYYYFYLPSINLIKGSDEPSKIYDGMTFMPTTEQILSQKPISELKLYYYEGDKQLEEAPIDIGTYTLKVSDSTLENAQDFGTVTITPRPVTVTANEQTIAYGESIKNTSNQVTASGLADGDTLTDITLTTSQNQIGTYTEAIEPSKATIEKETKDVTANYNITYQKGDLTINKIAAPDIASETKSYIYTLGSNGKTEEVDIASKLPKDRGATKYTMQIEDSSSILINPKIDTNGKLTYQVAKDKPLSSTAKLMVKVTTQYYEEMTFTLTIQLTDKRTVVQQEGYTVLNNGNELTYGQQLSELTLNPDVFIDEETGEAVTGTIQWKIQMQF